MSKYDDLVRKLKEIFQIDRPELDFGVYRILNARVGEINDYLENGLKAKVAESLAASGAGNLEALQKELKDKETQYRADGMDPDTVPKVKELRQKIADLGSGGAEHENAVFTHLLTFFSRYYDKGDFISQRRYKGDTYAIPYAGEEVVLHWADKEQYYTKSGENFSNYGFKLDDGRTVKFRLVAADTAKDNRKDNDKERRFVLVERHTRTVVDADGEQTQEEIKPVEEVDGELVVRFDYKVMPKGSRQDALVSDAVNKILSDPIVSENWLDLSKREPTEKNPQRTLLEKCLTSYTTKNSADYFVHKDLGRFLRRELDFYIKNEVMHLDDVQDAEKFADIEKSLRLIQTLRAIAHDLVAFLGQLEEFQKRLWLKKKFVVSTNYCVTLDRLPETLYQAIADNQKQWQQWLDLGMIEADAQSQGVGYLKAHPYLMADTALYDSAFKAALLAVIDGLDEKVDGVLIHSDNFQALNLLQDRYQEQIRCVYIDPPYNTTSSAIPYKNTFKHSAWATMMHNRVEKIAPLMSQDAAIFVSIDKHERQNLEHILTEVFSEDNQIEELIWSMNTNNSQAPNYSTNHEYVLVYAKNRLIAEQDKDMFREPKPGFAEVMELVARLNPEYPPVEVIVKELRQLYQQHQIEFREQVEADGLDWDTEQKNDPWKGLFNYSKAEYRDAAGWLVSEEDARELKAAIWIWQEGDASMPATKQSPTVNDPSHKNWRWYQPTHPVTGLPCVIPKSGWKFALEDDEDSPDKRSFKALDRDGRIAWGPDEKKVPRIKRMLHEVETNVGKSVFSDYSDGEKQTHGLFNRSGVFLAPKHSKFVSRFILHAAKKDSVVLDCFGGSGSTGHAVIAVNREDRGNRKYVLVEQGEYFDTVIKPRMQKVVFSPDWKGGKPTALTAGISHAFKVVKLESYEDTLNNLQLTRTAAQQSLLQSLPADAKEEYLLRYMLDIESRGSLLSVDQFKKPFDCKLKVTVDSAGAYEERTIDLVETFNYLIGLRVRHIDMQMGIGFVAVEGFLPTGEKALVLWRDAEKLDYEKLNRVCEKLTINPADSEFDVVYINGDHNIPAVFTSTEAEGGITKTLKIRQIEPEFMSRMFNTEA